MAQLIRGTPLPADHRERLLFMDIFGKRFEVYLDFSQAAMRQATIDSTIADLNTAETQVTTYCAAANLDLTQQLADGASAIAAELALDQPPPDTAQQPTQS